MIAASELQFEVRRRLNRFNTDYEKKLTVPVLDVILNEALEICFQQSALLYEVRDDIAINLEPLVLREVPLGVKNLDSKVVSDLPRDFYKRLRVRAKAITKKCKDSKYLIVRPFQTQKLDEGLKSPNWKPSYEWEETIGIQNGADQYFTYHNNDFEIEEVYLDYIKKHPKISTPSLAQGGSYIDASNTRVIADQGLIMDNAYQKRQICDIAAMLALRDLGDSVDYQTQINKILFTNSHYLGGNNNQ